MMHVKNMGVMGGIIEMIIKDEGIDSPNLSDKDREYYHALKKASEGRPGAWIPIGKDGMPTTPEKAAEEMREHLGRFTTADGAYYLTQQLQQ